MAASQESTTSSPSTSAVPTPVSAPSTPSKTDSISSSEKEAKDQKAFENWRKTLSRLTGVGLSPEEFQEEVAKADRRQCELNREQLVKTSPGVRFMMNNLAKAGCPLTKNMLECGPCDATKAGGFSKDHGVLLCQNGFFSKKHMEHTMIHEMIHMYDHCVFGVDWSNLRHHACSEIRAAALGGDCNWTREVRRGFYTFTKQHQECVRRRAILSVQANPDCPSRAAAEKAVNAVFDSCYNDTRPFDEFY